MTVFPGYRINAAVVFQSLGWIVDQDFIAIEVGATTTIGWKSGSTIPTIAAIDAAAASAVSNIATAAAQARKAAATAGIDNGQLQVGDKQERIARALALLILDEINILRAAVLHPVVSITRVTTTATVTTLDPHGLNTGDTARIMGATLAAYNVAAIATVTNANVFTYPVAGSPATPAVGSMWFAMGVIPPTQQRTVVQLINAIKAKIAATAE